MKKPYFSTFFLILSAFLSACAQTPPPTQENAPSEAEIHAWFPPTQKELEFRKLHQKELDLIEGDIEALFFEHEKHVLMENELRDSVAQVDPKIAELQAKTNAEIEALAKKRQDTVSELDSLKSGADKLSKRIEEYESIKPRPEFSPADYTRGMTLFKEREYQKSVDQFLLVLKQNPPQALMDNIHFAMGSAYFKIKNYPKALDHLNRIVSEYPQGDKWHMSYVLMGLIHNTMGEKSKAIYGLDQALKNNPPTPVIRLINRLIRLIDKDA
ncbi:MAG: tetratricopeptide repeat protein [Candidatus Nitrohelix vancouverensis]|uniref:Tetratricopeptide repeat protein n=1 Tax=Candidatus Nitrohelix vancouverensis TaxID=2705534 RepID=A0A7T0G3X5_9BACT|nr:MAG: tetratricopeptide repeat protein [Candidatus Nitrohelix vancouverensis]